MSDIAATNTQPSPVAGSGIIEPTDQTDVNNATIVDNFKNAGGVMPSQSSTSMSPASLMSGGNCMLKRGGRKSHKKQNKRTNKRTNKRSGRKSHKKHSRKVRRHRKK